MTGCISIQKLRSLRSNKKGKNELWIHIKDQQSLYWILERSCGLRYFCHGTDSFTFTSNGFIWNHDAANVVTNKCIVPLINREDVHNNTRTGFYAVCSDYIYDCERRLQ